MSKDNGATPHPGARILAWGVAAIDLLAALACTLLYALNRGSAVALLTTLASGLLPLSGAVIIARQPRNPVGWLVAAIGYTFVGGDLLVQYGTFALITHPGLLPLGGLAAWISSDMWMAVYALAVPFILLIPNGRLLSRGWQALIWISAVTTLPVILDILVVIAPMDKGSLLKSQSSNFPVDASTPLIWKILPAWQVLQFLLILLAAIALFVRFTHSRGVERQQLKWIFLAIATIPVSVGFGLLTIDNQNSLLNAVNQGLNLLSACAFPVGLAFAVTRYRLYDIDVIIRRTLVYSILTLTLAGVYLGSVILLQEIFNLLTGERSPASIVISTLIIAALFTPLRRRIQGVIDRRFFRAHYNTEQILERFASQQRESVDLEQYCEQILEVVEDTLHPQSVSLYLVKTSKDRQEPH